MLSKREQIIITAMHLFDEYGFHATGIDTIVREAKVSKKTLYHHFRTKDELILSVLQHKDSIARNALMKAVEEQFDSPIDRLLGVFDLAAQWYGDEHFFGCLYVNAAGEFPDDNSAIRHACRNHKLQLKAYFRQLSEQAGLTDADQISDSLFMLYEGATVSALLTNDSGAAMRARKTAVKLIDMQRPQ